MDKQTGSCIGLCASKKKVDRGVRHGLQSVEWRGACLGALCLGLTFSLGLSAARISNASRKVMSFPS